ncbi:hypothetical protein, partial [Pseudomonas orientalis]|uniref:hypothetical protein n=1 Tax=Pseudomonas orientalis TaxID=76758 RepID=UPI00071452B4
QASTACAIVLHRREFCLFCILNHDTPKLCPTFGGQFRAWERSLNLALMEERWPDVKFRATREHH